MFQFLFVCQQPTFWCRQEDVLRYVLLVFRLQPRPSGHHTSVWRLTSSVSGGGRPVCRATERIITRSNSLASDEWAMGAVSGPESLHNMTVVGLPDIQVHIPVEFSLRGARSPRRKRRSVEESPTFHDKDGDTKVD
ncbi:hypothetical protein NHX12_003158 [Muraenolepis orangiensis]|uniref:Uncharacterized protein n=1 Tax=Muraenolepis orangiensis TaxID=630683 RepID=A0A9Q0IDT3_9TELE|nr:hypothetical protein NHX12_003158 [Muraenolepis orangiensis]